MTYLIIFLAAVFFIIASKKFDLAVLIVVASVPLYVVRWSIGNLPTTLLEILIIILFIVWLAKNYQSILTRLKYNFNQGKIKKRYPFDWELISWLIIGLTSAMLAGLTFKDLGLWRAYFFEPALLFIIFVNTFSTKEKIIKLAYAFGVSALVVVAISYYQFITGQFIPNEFWVITGSRRATSLFPFPNAVSLYLGPIIFFLLGVVLTIYKTNKKLSYGLLSIIVLSASAIVLAKSEGGVFAVVLVSFIGLLLANNKARLVALGLIIIIGLGLCFWPKFNNYVVERVTLNNFSGQVRKIQWRETINMLYHGKIVTGAGLNNYQVAIEPWHQKGFFFNKEKLSQTDFVNKIKSDKIYREAHWQPLEIYLYPHNIFLNFWSELGLIGLLLFLWLVIKYFYFSLKAFSKEQKINNPDQWLNFGLILVMLNIIIHGLVDVPYFKNDLAILFWLWLALVGILWKKLSYKN